MKNAPLTKDYLDQRLDAMESRIVGSIQGINENFNKSQGLQNERMDRIEGKLDGVAEDVSKIKLAVVDLIGTDRHMHNLVRELKGHGIPLDNGKIFV